MEIIKLNREYATQALKEIPAGYIDKSVCGCGMTSVAFENDIDTIIFVPNIELATNKAKQYPNGRTRNTLLPVWGETSTEKIVQYVKTTTVIKIVCVYDSLHKVEHLLDRCRMIIDEAQELLPLSCHSERAKAISKLFEIAYKYRDTVSFISATPTPIEYLPKWVSKIPQIKYEWNHTFKAVPILYKHCHPFRVLKHEILAPLNENKPVNFDGNIFSKVIVFMNTVDQIVKIISELEIDKSRCAIICGDNIRNDLKIRGIPRLKDPWNLPLFTFVTASGFKGIDLYDTQAMTIIVSCTQKKWQMVDIFTDLKQAVSRQREKNNPNYGKYIYIYNQSEFEKSEEELKAELNEVKKKVEASITLWEYANSSGILHGWTYDKDILAYTLITEGKRVMNKMAFSAEMYFILELRRQYTKGFDIGGHFDGATTMEAKKLPSDITYAEMASYFKENHADGKIDWGIYAHKISWIKIIETCYNLYGKVWKNITDATKMIENHDNPYGQLIIRIKGDLMERVKYSNKHVIETLSNIYKELGLARSAKLRDLYGFCIFDESRNSLGRSITIKEYKTY